MNDTSVPAAKAQPLHAHASRDERTPERTHWAHVAVVAIHALCCGVPIVASLAGLAASAALMGGVLRFHSFLHGRELWLLGISAVLVAAGWLAEQRFVRRTGRAVSPLFWVSLACFAFNAAIVAGHRIGG